MNKTYSGTIANDRINSSFHKKYVSVLPWFIIIFENLTHVEECTVFGCFV